MNILIVEDEVIVAEDLANDLKNMGFEVVDIAISSEECFLSFEKKRPDVILMDIRIKGDINGIELANRLREKSEIPIIYLTSNTDPATIKEAIESRPQAFISKPYNRKDLKAALELAFMKHNEAQLERFTGQPLDSSVFVKDGDFYKRLNLSEILYIEASGSYCNVFTSKKTYVLSFNLHSFEGKIMNSSFVRIHRSYIVNVNNIEGLGHNTVVINDKEFPISLSYREEVVKLFHKL